MDRHDLAYLKPQANVHFLEPSISERVKQKMSHLLQKNIPLTICRQDMLEINQLKLAITCFVGKQKYRIAVLVDTQDIHQIMRPVPLATIIPQLPRHTHQQLNIFIDYLTTRNCNAYVYGSYAYQYLTQESYINTHSDLDLVLYPKNLDVMTEILTSIMQLQQNVEIKIDGEIKITPDWHVSFNELIQILPDINQQIIAKGIRQIGIFPLKELLEDNYADTCISTE